MQDILNINNLSFAYNKELVLQNINLTVKNKDFLAIIGPNGGGKSTLLKLILGLYKPKEGTVNILNNNSSNNLENIGYVPQNTNINTSFPIRVLDVVLMGHIHKDKKRKNIFEKIFNINYSKSDMLCAKGALIQVGMEKYLNNTIGSLSGGQRQRVMIARALCAHPKILILDEPTASIDIQGQEQIYNLLQILNKSITIIVVSHDISVILNYASKVAHINKILTFHDIKLDNKLNKKDDHFCEVELLQMLNSTNSVKKSCKC